MSLLQKAMAKAKQQNTGKANAAPPPAAASPVMRTKPVIAQNPPSPAGSSSSSSSVVARFKPIAPAPKLTQPVTAPITPPRAPLSPSSAFVTRQPSSEEEEEEDSGEGEFSEEEEDEKQQPVTSTIRQVAEAAVAAVFPSPQQRPAPREASPSVSSSEEEVITKRLPPTQRQPYPSSSSSEEEDDDEQEEYIVRRVKSRSGGTGRRRRSRTPNPPSAPAHVVEAIKLRQRSPRQSPPQQQQHLTVPPVQAWSTDIKRRLLIGFLVFIVSFLVLDQQWNKQVTLPPTIQLQLGPSTTFEDLAESTLDKDELRGFELELKSKLQHGFESSLPVSHLYTAYQETRRTNTKMLLGAGLLAGFVIAGVFM